CSRFPAGGSGVRACAAEPLREVGVEVAPRDALAPVHHCDQPALGPSASWVVELPDDRAVRGDLEQAAAVGLRDERVAVRQALDVRAYLARQRLLLRAAIDPGDLARDRIHLDDSRDARGALVVA